MYDKYVWDLRKGESTGTLIIKNHKQKEKQD